MMDFKEFFEAFKDGQISIVIDDSPEFKELCGIIEENGLHVFRKAEWTGTLYEYAQNRSGQWDKIAVDGEVTATNANYRKNIRAADISWLHGPTEEFLSILEEGSIK